MTGFLRSRGIVAVGALLLSLAGGSTAAFAQGSPSLPTAQNFDLRTQASAVRAAPPITTAGPQAATPSPAGPVQASFVSAVQRALATPSFANPAPAPIAPIQPRLQLAVPATTGYSALPLAALVDANSIGDLDEEATCLATAVYFESKGEPLEGQLAVAQVVMNRAVSGRFPTTLCGVVKQRAQFSFVRGGAFPSFDAGCQAWRKAQAIARIAQKHLVPALPHDVLWYHADYVAPRWREALVVVEKIGAHIFYRA